MEYIAEPFSDQLLAEPIIDDKSIGGFILPESAKTKITKAKVIKVGPGNGDYTMQSKEGSLILFNENRGVTFELNGRKVIIIREQDCYLKLTERPA